jgi:hypothetical protein
MSHKIIIQNINARIFPMVLSIGSALTIAVCYIISTSLGNNKPFPETSISGTAQYSPTKYIWRCVMIPIAVVQAYVWNIALQVLKRESNKIRAGHSLEYAAFWLGIIASVSLVISAMCLTAGHDFPKALHGVSSVFFFALSLIAQDLVTIKLYYIAKERNLQIDSNLVFKAVLNVIGTTLLIGAVVVSVLRQPKWQLNVIEWSGTTVLLIYCATFCFDWHSNVSSSIILEEEEELL